MLTYSVSFGWLTINDVKYKVFLTCNFVIKEILFVYRARTPPHNHKQPPAPNQQLESRFSLFHTVLVKSMWQTMVHGVTGTVFLRKFHPLKKILSKTLARRVKGDARVSQRKRTKSNCHRPS